MRVICEDRCMLKEAATTRSRRSQIFFKIDVPKNFAIFTGKHLRWSWSSFFHRTFQMAASALRVIPDVLIFVNIEIVGKLKYTNGLQLGTSLKSDLLHRYLLFPFFVGTSILNIFI